MHRLNMKHILIYSVVSGTAEVLLLLFIGSLSVLTRTERLEAYVLSNVSKCPSSVLLTNNRQKIRAAVRI